MKIFNTLTKQIEEFTPLHDDFVGIYSCGPTVYNHAHIGNLSSYIYADILRRNLQSYGYNVKHIMNFTDVDDKTIRDSRIAFPDEEPMTALEKLTTKYGAIFKREMSLVGNNIQQIRFVKATDNIANIEKLINKLLADNIAYVASDGIYFNVQKYSEHHIYGQLVKLDPTHAAEHRINNDDYSKADVADFALWKKQKPGEPAWDLHLSDGKIMTGRPGWHIECSAMSVANLGQPFDIHTGGVDLIFPHHENEIAQSTAGDQPDKYANFFVHSEHLLVDNKKMSKSLNNFYTLGDLEKKGFAPLSFRLFVLQSHYSSPTNFTWQAIESAQNKLLHWCNIASYRHQVVDAMNESQLNQVHDLIQEFTSHLDNNLTTSQAIMTIDKIFNLFTPDNTDLQALQILLQTINDYLGIDIMALTPDLSEDQYQLIAERNQHRANRDWAAADEIRNKLITQKIAINDGDKTIWSRTNLVNLD